MSATARRATILASLALLMAATRVHHFAAVPDASWAVFFLGGLYLRPWTRLAFPALMVLAVAIDALVIQAQGLSFWQHYCVSPAYWCLIPAHFALWMGGAWLRGYRGGRAAVALARLAAALIVSVALCHLVAQGSFYWISDSVMAPTLAGWWKNYTDWLPAYLWTTALYVGAAVMAHLVLARGAPRSATARALGAD